MDSDFICAIYTGLFTRSLQENVRYVLFAVRIARSDIKAKGVMMRISFSCLILCIFFGCTNQNTQSSTQSTSSTNSTGASLAANNPGITTLMQKYSVPGLSITGFQDGQFYQKSYGQFSFTNSTPVNSNTLFQAASISKAVNAIGVLILVQQGKLDLDRNVNDYLDAGWKLKDSNGTVVNTVTLRRLLSHTAGTNVWGFAGYVAGANRANSTLDVLKGYEGSSSVNSWGVKVELTPGNQQQYSGGGITVTQYVIELVTGQNYSDWMKANVLLPFGMNDSSFEQPLLNTSNAASGNENGSEIPGKWNIYPEKAAAGLWTTPTDLAKFLSTLSRIYRGQQNTPLSKNLVNQAFTRVAANDGNQNKNGGTGLGFFIWDNELAVSHSGVNKGFRGYFVLLPNRNLGFAFMFNSEVSNDAFNTIIQSVQNEYFKNTNLGGSFF